MMFFWNSIVPGQRRHRATYPMILVAARPDELDLSRTSFIGPAAGFVARRSTPKAATAAVARASSSLRDLRVAEVSELDLQIEDGQVRAYRAKVKVSFKYEGDE
jgi:Uncharacterized conserved protein